MKIQQRFTAFDEDGNQFEILKWVSILKVGTLTDPHATRPGLPSFMLSDGRDLNQLDENTFELVQSGETLRVNKK